MKELHENSFVEGESAQKKNNNLKLQDNVLSQQFYQQSKQQQEIPFKQYNYRWVIVSIAIFATFVNGLANNNVMPVVHKISQTYEISTFYANFPVTLSLLVFALVNFPATDFIDKKGLRFSFILGTALYSIGLFLFMFLDKGYHFAVLGAIVIAIGQPFIVNCPAKIATLWFLSKNRTMATTSITIFQIIGSATGFVFPASFVEAEVLGLEAKNQFFNLYFIEFAIGFTCFILIVIFMREKPPTSPSLGASIQKMSLSQSFVMIRKDKNLIFFILGYMVIAGSFLSFGANSNLILTPFGFSDFQIAMLAIELLVTGVTGAILASLYIKKTLNYGGVLRAIPLVGIVVVVVLIFCLNFLNYFQVMMLIGIFLGSVFTPTIPISFDLMCQIGFPIGEAQAIGILAGSCMIWTFIVSNTFTLTLGLKSTTDSTIALSIICCLLFIGFICFSNVKIKLKRRQSEKIGHLVQQVHETESQVQQQSNPSDLKKISDTQTTSQKKSYKNQDQ